MEESQKPKLKHIETGTVIVISECPFLIGRGLSCHYVIPSVVISKEHCRLEKKENKWLLIDKSRNGTYINGSAVKTDGVYLNNEDIISLCPEGHTYKFLLTSTAELLPVATSVCTASTTRTEATTSAPPPVTDDVAELLNSDLELEAVLSALSSSLPSSPAPSSATVPPTAIAESRSETKSNKVGTVALPGTSRIRKSPSSFDLPSNKKSKFANVTKTETGLDDNGNPTEHHGTSVQNMEPSCDTKETKNLPEKDVDVNTQLQENIEEMEDEMQCSICSEMFIKATTLNCSHTFCKYCIETWKKNRNICPICRAKITSLNSTLVLDNVIEKVIRNASDEVKKHRETLLEERKKLEAPKVTISNTINSRGRGANRGQRGRGNINSNRGRNYNHPIQNPTPAPTIPVIEVESSSDSDLDSSESEDTDSDGWREEYDNDEWYLYCLLSLI